MIAFLNKEKFNYYGFKHEEVNKKLEGDLTYISTFCFDHYEPAAVYYNSNPNLEKGHKPFLLLYTRNGDIFVSGRSFVDFDRNRYQAARYCPFCKDVIYSITTHHFMECECKRYFIDGGRSYVRTNCTYVCCLDHLTGAVDLC